MRTIMRTESRFAGILLLLALGTVGCVTPTATPEAPPESSPVTVTPERSSAASAFSATNDTGKHTESEIFWLQLTAPPTDGSEGPVVFRKHGLAVSQLDYNLALQEFLADRPRTTELEKSFRESLDEQLLVLRWIQLRSDQYTPRERVVARRKIRQLFQDWALESELGSTDPAEEEIRAVYDRDIDQYQSKEMVQIRLILVPDETIAGEILQRLDSGENFRAIALAESIHESRDRGGDLEPFARGAYIAELEDLAFTMPVGALGTVKTNVGTFIIQKVANIPAVTIPYEQAREEIRATLEEQGRETGREQLLQRMRDKVSLDTAF